MSIEGINVNKERIYNTIQISLNARENRYGIFEKEIKAPEEEFIKLIKDYGQNTNDDNFALNALFFTTSLIHAENTELFFKKFSEAELLNKYAWIFQPEKVLDADSNGIDVEKECKNFFRPGGYNKTTFSQWVHNCSVLQNKFGGDMKNFFKANNDDSTKIIESLVVKPRAKTSKKPDFRRYGPKLSRLFVQWVDQYGFYELKNTQNNGIPVDFQVSRIMIQTKGIELDKPTGTHHVSVRTLLPLLSEMCLENNWQTREVSETLWYIGSKCCNKERHDLCPLEETCDSMISRDSYDSNGLFDPQDTGRYNSK